MDSDLERELKRLYPELNLEEPLLRDWLSDKCEPVFKKWGPQRAAETAQVAIDKYWETRANFMRALSQEGLDEDKVEHARFARDLWEGHGYPELSDDDYDIHVGVEAAASEVRGYLRGEQEAASSSSSLGDPNDLLSRFDSDDADTPIRYTAKQREFLEAFSEFFSKTVELDYRLLRFRRNVLGDPDRTISHEVATNLVRSPAIQRLRLSFFRKFDIPVVGHTARRVRVGDSRWVLRIEPGAHSLDTSTIRTAPASFRWIAPGGRLEKHPVTRGSVLEDLKRICEDLAKRLPMTEELVAYLVLCGKLVQLPSISGRIDIARNEPDAPYDYEYSTVTLTIATWATPEQVRQAYAKLRGKAKTRNTYRTKSTKNVGVFRFVMERATPRKPKDHIPGTRGTFKLPPWREMVEEWNQRLPTGHKNRFDQPAPTAEKMFRKAFTEGYRNVTGQEYSRPRPILTRKQLEAAVSAERERFERFVESLPVQAEQARKNGEPPRQ